MGNKFFECFCAVCARTHPNDPTHPSIAMALVHVYSVTNRIQMMQIFNAIPCINDNESYKTDKPQINIPHLHFERDLSGCYIYNIIFIYNNTSIPIQQYSTMASQWIAYHITP